MPSKQKIRNGDVFETLLPDGRFGAIRVIKTEDVSFLIATTPYISTKPPEILDPQLKAIQVNSFGNWQNKPDLCGYRHAKLLTRRYVGNIPLSPEEELMRLWFGPGGYAIGSWGDWVGHSVYRQWRWDHDRESFEAEVKRENEERKKALQIQPKPKKMMADDDFWKLISLLDWSKTGNDDAVVEPVVKALATLKKGELRQFHEALCYKLFLLDTQDHAKNSTEFDSEKWRDQLSVDGFLYSRCVVVANGREYYEKILHDPTSMPKDLEFEALLYLSQNAYAKKAGNDDFDYEPGCSFETYSNIDGWK